MKKTMITIIIIFRKILQMQAIPILARQRFDCVMTAWGRV
jgi:hypothetical protein